MSLPLELIWSIAHYLSLSSVIPFLRCYKHLHSKLSHDEYWKSRYLFHTKETPPLSVVSWKEFYFSSLSTFCFDIYPEPIIFPYKPSYISGAMMVDIFANHYLFLNPSQHICLNREYNISPQRMIYNSSSRGVVRLIYLTSNHELHYFYHENVLLREKIRCGTSYRCLLASQQLIFLLVVTLDNQVYFSCFNGGEWEWTHFNHSLGQICNVGMFRNNENVLSLYFLIDSGFCYRAELNNNLSISLINESVNIVYLTSHNNTLIMIDRTGCLSYQIDEIMGVHRGSQRYRIIQRNGITMIQDSQKRLYSDSSLIEQIRRENHYFIRDN